LALDPGSGMEKFGSGIRDKYPGSAIGAFLALDPGSGMEKIRIWDPDKYPGSATLIETIFSNETIQNTYDVYIFLNAGKVPVVLAQK
jgi:hypothetical protein